MGFPLSTFQQLSRLCQNEPFIKRVFNDFKLTAIIVHDPTDDDFRREIKYSFEHLHEITGNDFAFLSFINPPARWAAAHTDWMNLRETLSGGDGFDDIDFVLALQRRLLLPKDPCLVLTSDLLLDKYVILPTAKDYVVSHLESISEFAHSTLGNIPIDSQEFINFLSKLGPAFIERTEDRNSLAKNIADLVAVRALTGAGATRRYSQAREAQIEEAYSYVKAELRSLWNSIIEARSEGDPDKGSNLLDKFSDYLAQVICVAEQYGHRDPQEHMISQRQVFMPLERMYALSLSDFKGVEDTTLTYLLNYNRILPVYTCSDLNRRFQGIDLEYLSPEGFKLDFSPLGTFLGKAMEEEINASLVQRVRQIMGVHMPRYYRKYEDGLNDSCSVKTERKDIELNKKGKWLSDTDYTDRSYPMGEVLCVLREIAKDESKAFQMGVFCRELFINTADGFVRSRNASCHPGLFDRSAFNTMFEKFQVLSESFLPQMNNIKESLRSLTSIPLPWQLV